MKLTQNIIIHVVLGVAVASAMTLLYLLLARRGQSQLAPAQWAVFGGAALAIVLAAFVPGLVRRRRRLPPTPPLSPSDIGFCLMVALAGSVLAVVGVFSEWWWLMTLGIGLAPLALLLRFAPSQHSNSQN
jgi:hypothetical protein